MRKLLVVALLTLGVGVAGAVDLNFRIPKDVSGNPDQNSDYGAIESCILATSTTPALATDPNSVTIKSGLIYWVVRPATGAAGAFLEFRDTNTANVSSARLTPFIAPLSTGSATTQVIVGDQVLRFDPPIPFYNGLSYNLLPVGAAPPSGFEFSFGVRKRR